MKNTILITSLAALALLGLASTASAAVFKCRQPDGRIAFRDSPCPEGEEVWRKKHSPKPAATPYEDPEFDTRPESLLPLRAAFFQALGSLSPLRMNVVEYLQMNGDWPASLTDLRLDPKTMTSADIQSVEVSKGGVIRVRLGASLGKDKQIQLTPMQVMGGRQVEWACAANFPAALFESQPKPLCESASLR